MNNSNINKLPFVSLCVASFNRKDIIIEALSSSLNQNYSKKEFEVILIDNFSSDGTVEEVEKIFFKEINTLRLKILKLKHNTGTSGTYIEVMPYLNSKWEYMLKLDGDLVLEKNCLIEMINLSKKIKEPSMIGGKVYYYKERNKIHAIGSKLSPFFAIAKGVGVNKIEKNMYNSVMKIDALNGCMFLIPKIIYEKVGWFDNDYFLYYDDHEIMFKALKKGYNNYFCPTAIAYHDTLTGTKAKYSNKVWLYYSTRSSFLFLLKNFSFFSFDFFCYFFAHNIKFIWGLLFIFLYSKKNNIFYNLSSYFLGYYHGIKRRGGYYEFKN